MTVKYNNLCLHVDIVMNDMQQEFGSGGKKTDAGEEWREQNVEDRLEYALVRV